MRCVLARTSTADDAACREPGARKGPGSSLSADSLLADAGLSLFELRQEPMRAPDTSRCSAFPEARYLRVAVDVSPDVQASPPAAIRRVPVCRRTDGRDDGADDRVLRCQTGSCRQRNRRGRAAPHSASGRAATISIALPLHQARLKKVASTERGHLSVVSPLMYTRRNRYWTAAEDQRLREMAISGVAITRIAAALRRSQSAIASRSKELNVSICKPRRLPAAERHSVIR
jgi:hypothetical protein